MSFYDELGVSADASKQEIQTTYRGLAKLYHPDVNSSAAATDKFRSVTLAYETLSDAEKRKKYDQSLAPNSRVINEDNKGQKTESNKTDFVRCSVCNKVTASPRFRAFYSVTSFLLATWKNPKVGIFCSECANNVALKQSVKSSLFGWWGFPWGPIWTISETFRNIIGGKKFPEIDEELRWQNVVAFLQSGNSGMAGSIAANLVDATNTNIANAARDLLSNLKTSGVPIKKLKAASNLSSKSVLWQLLMLCLILGTFGGYLYLDSANYNRSPVTSSQQIASRTSTSELSSEYEVEELEIVDLCSFHPFNNAVLVSKIDLLDFGHGMSFENGTSSDAMIKIRDANRGNVVLSLYVEKSQTGNISGLPDGDYIIQFAYGDAMNAECLEFLNPTANRFPDTQSMRMTEAGNQISSQVLNFTLYKSISGNVRTQAVDDYDFLKP